MSKFRAIIFDIDGTAMPIRHDAKPSTRLVNAIASIQKKYRVSVATGRDRVSAERFINMMNITEPCIIAAGTELYDPINKSILWRENIKLDSHAHIIESLKTVENHIFSGNYGWKDAVNGSGVEALLDNDTAVLYIINVDPKTADKLEQDLKVDSNLTIINMHAFENDELRDIHIHSANASKEHAVNVLLKLLNIPNGETIGIGDGHNDLHLFRAVGYKVAMGNAVPELKSNADETIGDISEDGLAEYFERLIND